MAGGFIREGGRRRRTPDSGGFDGRTAGGKPTHCKRLIEYTLSDPTCPTWLTLTSTQYHTLRQWEAGQFSREGWVLLYHDHIPGWLYFSYLGRNNFTVQIN